jgi:peptide deformylase
VSIPSLEIVHYPHPALRHLSKPLKRVDADLRAMIEQMFELMYEHEGVGLAANQVDLPYRVFIANPQGDPSIKEAEAVFINPVLSKGRGQMEGDEGCLSIPGVHAPVVRKEKITITAYNLAGEEVTGELTGLFSRVVQHETDHLDGRLFIDRLTPTQAAEIRADLEEFEITFESKRGTGEVPSDEQIAARLAELEQLRT